VIDSYNSAADREIVRDDDLIAQECVFWVTPKYTPYNFVSGAVRTGKIRQFITHDQYCGNIVNQPANTG